MNAFLDDEEKTRMTGIVTEALKKAIPDSEVFEVDNLESIKALAVILKTYGQELVRSGLKLLGYGPEEKQRLFDAVGKLETPEIT